MQLDVFLKKILYLLCFSLDLLKTKLVTAFVIISKIVTLPRLLLAPAVFSLLLWMVIPLVMTVYFSFIRYNLINEANRNFSGWFNYDFFLTDPSLPAATWNTILMLGSIVLINIVGGIFIALLIEKKFPGQKIVRLLLISPFFVMPTVNALLWKNMMMNPIYGILSQIFIFFGQTPVDWLSDFPLLSVIIIVSWQWLPFAVLIFITSLQSMDREQLEAAEMDGASYMQKVRYLYLAHLARPISIVTMIEVIFLISVFAEIFTTTSGGPGDASTNITYLIYKQALLGYDIGVASAGAVFAIVFANIVAVFLIRIIGKSLD